ncbi:MAG: PRC-barrel domain-containing protein [Propionibacteriaceae bacterium]|jgi:hypothetical protein|nr:PRC-barrel domain-containing protein [Propionibacteriaceae bacterium]
MAGITVASVAELIRASVVDRDGVRVGSVGQVYQDDRNGLPRWVSVRIGFLGSKEVFVPLAEAEILPATATSTAASVITVPYSAALIRDSPSVDPNGHLTSETEIMLYHYYDIETKAGSAVSTDAETLDDLID